MYTGNIFTLKIVRLCAAVKSCALSLHVRANSAQAAATSAAAWLGPHTLAPSSGGCEKRRSAEQDVVASPGRVSPPKLFLHRATGSPEVLALIKLLQLAILKDIEGSQKQSLRPLSGSEWMQSGCIAFMRCPLSKLPPLFYPSCTIWRWLQWHSFLSPPHGHLQYCEHAHRIQIVAWMQTKPTIDTE